MVKGISKQVVLVKPQGEAAFEQALFIVKDGAGNISEQELLRQAGAAAQAESGKSGETRFSGITAFFSGAGLVAIGWFLTAIL